METSGRFRVSIRSLGMIWLMLSFFTVVFAAEELSMYVVQPTTLKLSSGLPVKNSPGSRSGAVVVCERIHIHGLSRLNNLKKYADSVKIKVKVVDKSRRATLPNAEVCFHRNISLGIGMCPQGQWEKVIQGSWIHSMSPYDNKLLDIRMPGPSLEILEVSIEEEFLLYRVIFLVLGIIMLNMAPCMSKSIVFYYSGAMAVGVILVILMVLFQGMRLLPTGRKNSLAIVIYSSLVGVGSFLFRYLPGLLHSLLVEIGISDDMYTPLVTLLLVCIILAGAWLGFWVVRKLILTEDGSIDLSVALFVAWSIRILSAVMIIQSSLDPLLATAALLSGILVSSTMRIPISRFLRRVNKLVFRTMKSNRRKSRMHDSPSEGRKSQMHDSPSEGRKSRMHDSPSEGRKSRMHDSPSEGKKSWMHDSPSEDLHDESRYRSRRSEEAEFLGHKTGWFTLASCNSLGRDMTKTPPPPLSDSETYFSTFHDTPERKKFSKEEWEIFTQDSTKKALEELVSSPDFSKWAVKNAERITLAPPKISTSERHSRWLPWL